MTFDYNRSAATADRLIKRFGTAGTLRRPTATGPAYNPTPGAPDDHAVQFVITDYSNREIDGSRILATDKKALVSAIGLAIEPTLSDQLLDADAKPYKIVAVQTLRPATTTVFYELQVRR